ncbi:MAG: hypothetical protein OJF59_002345 [Cytophagales bacterium]|nr:hypothetical protein [Bacteroidota bacterium]MBS1981474.1 hypothetical protein [Bacteroidota bacterium]WHZ08591.1 MAG: hypothetical protein OJF59_002345 [Cytophagales bacterium]
MSRYFLSDSLTGLPPLAFERFLFNEERHLFTQSDHGWHIFSWVNAEVQQTEARICFHVENGIARSPYRAPFGSVQFTGSLSADHLLQFLTETIKRLEETGVKQIIIRDAPQLYRPKSAALLAVLLGDLGFVSKHIEINASIPVDNQPLENKISHDERYHLRRAQREGLRFNKLETTEWESVYRFIYQCRAERGMKLSMTAHQLGKTIEACPHDFLFFEVCKGNERLAAAIAVQVNPRILYNFYYGHSYSSNALSPVVLLLNGQYDFCNNRDCRVLDMGTSMRENKINLSLLHFKRQVGGELSMKLTFEKTY